MCVTRNLRGRQSIGVRTCDDLGSSVNTWRVSWYCKVLFLCRHDHTCISYTERGEGGEGGGEGKEGEGRGKR